MDIIPAIDLKNGSCVRLQQGKDHATTEYSADPVGVAQQWVDQGAHRLHLVNLDGAFGRASAHLEILRKIARIPALRVQYGGGLRTREAVEEAFHAGANRVVLGTIAVEAPTLFHEILDGVGPDRCIVAVDAVGGMVAVRGWTAVTEIPAVDLVRRLWSDGIREVLYTDVARDGMLSGPDMTLLQELADTGMNVISSGGIATTDDVRRVLDLGHPHISGIIIGKALYERTVSLRDLLSLVTSWPAADERRSGARAPGPHSLDPGP